MEDAMQKTVKEKQQKKSILMKLKILRTVRLHTLKIWIETQKK
jgi:hypothetical protein